MAMALFPTTPDTSDDDDDALANGGSTSPGWTTEVLHDPGAPKCVDNTVLEVAVDMRPFVFFVKFSGADAARRLHRITLPRSWAKATIGKLTDMLASRSAVPSWDCHLVVARGPLDSSLPIAAAIVHKETAELVRGPAPALGTHDRMRHFLWVWGRTVDGHLCPTPRRQPGLGSHSIRAVAMGDEHVACVTSVGLVLTWGHNECGQLGTGDERPRAAPRVVRALSCTRCVAVSCGAHCTGAIEESGHLWSFGANQPANRPTRFHESWANRRGATAAGLHVLAVAFGYAHVLVLSGRGVDGSRASAHDDAETDEDKKARELNGGCAGTGADLGSGAGAGGSTGSGAGGVRALWSWGYNESFQLGWSEAVGNPLLRVGFQKPRAPLDMGSLGGVDEGGVVAIACGEAHSACLTAAGSVFAWGDNSTGQCGAVGGGALVPLPLLLVMPQGDAKVRRLLCLGNATIAITVSGCAYILGGGGRLKGERGEEEEADEADEDEGGEADEAAGAAAEDAQRQAASQRGQAVEDGGGAGSAPEGRADVRGHAHQEGGEGEGEGTVSAVVVGGGGGGGGMGGVARGLGRLLGTRRLLAEHVVEAAGCVDHLLFLSSDDALRGVGYNR